MEQFTKEEGQAVAAWLSAEQDTPEYDRAVLQLMALGVSAERAGAISLSDAIVPMCSDHAEQSQSQNPRWN